MTIPGRNYWRWSGIFIVNIDHIQNLSPVSALFTLSMHLFAGKGKVGWYANPVFELEIEQMLATIFGIFTH